MTSLHPGQQILTLPIGGGEYFYHITEDAEPRFGIFRTYEAATLAFEFTDDEIAEIWRALNDAHAYVRPMDVDHLAAYCHRDPSGGALAFAVKH